MSVLSIGKLRSRRYIRVELKKSTMGWDFKRETYARVNPYIHRRVKFYDQPYPNQAICGQWAYLPTICVQAKDRGEGKTFKESNK